MVRVGVFKMRKYYRWFQNVELYKKYFVVYLFVFNFFIILLYSLLIFKCNEIMDLKILDFKCFEDNIQDWVILFCYFIYGD